MNKSTIKGNSSLTKNTVSMYFRMAITMIVNLFASRIILSILGVEGYGLYSVVGGVVILFTFIQSSLTTTTQRYLSYELGKKNFNKIIDIFNSSFWVYMFICIIIIILSETIGLYFLNNYMRIPQNNFFEANWIYQCAILTTCFSAFISLYQANLVANERFSFYAYMGIAESILKLLVIFLLYVINYEKLIVYSILNLCVSIAILFIYILYSKKHFKYLKISTRINDKNTIKEILNFSSWSILGAIANMGFRQGINLVINIFYGVSLNAGFGIANQISSLVYQFVGSFQAAINPRLTKSQAEGNITSQSKLNYQASKFMFFLLFIPAYFMIINIDWILKIWLGDVPPYAAIFCKLMLIGSLVDTITAPFWVTLYATGNIKNYQLSISIILLLNIPLSYLSCKLGGSPEFVLWIRIFLYFCGMFVRLYFIKLQTAISVKGFLKKSLLPISYIVIITIPLGYIISIYSNLYRVLLSIPLFAVMVILILFIGLEKDERMSLSKLIFKR